MTPEQLAAKYFPESAERHARALALVKEAVADLSLRVEQGHSGCHDLVCNCDQAKHPRGAKDVGCSCHAREDRTVLTLIELQEKLQAAESRVERVEQELKIAVMVDERIRRSWDEEIEKRKAAEAALASALGELDALQAEVVKLKGAKKCLDCDLPVDDPRYDICSKCDTSLPSSPDAQRIAELESHLAAAEARCQELETTKCEEI